MAIIIVGTKAPNNNLIGAISFPKYFDSKFWPAGLGAFAITVNPPPVTAPATTAYLNFSAVIESILKLGTCEAKKVIAALSLNAVNTTEPMNSAVSLNADKTGDIHHPCNPPCVTSPAKKSPTNNGPLIEMEL